MAEPTVRRFQAMGSPARVVVEHGRTDLAAAVVRFVQDLEQRWSRFLADSEVSLLNRSTGQLTVVSDPTYRLVATAVLAGEATDGQFNPLMLQQLKAIGYRRPWGQGIPMPDGAAAVPGTGDRITLLPDINGVILPPGSGFDPGGIGKGLAVDLAIELCRAEGSSFGSVELGGDLRVYGPPWYGDRWAIGVAHPFASDSDIATFTPEEGAVTTSTTLKRRWFDGERWHHHLLDPATGRSSATDLVTVATCSSEAWWAEVVAKTALLAGSGTVLDVFHRLDTPGVAVTGEGRVLSSAEASRGAVTAA